ncbi:MAG: hypothetical protein PVJ57_20020 [Phycisphaerae bacterium]|jgi:hypothetical protein
MIADLRHILDGWDFEPGKISVRKIVGRGGEEKVQTRIDMGVLQIELDGRPDGQRPEGYESYLDLVLDRLSHHIELHGDDNDFLLSPDDCHELRHEAYLYYQRYLSLFVLEDFGRVARDTTRNLRVIDLCEQYATSPEDRSALGAQRAYVVMMNARARACGALERGDYEAALAAVRAGVVSVSTLYEREESDEDVDDRNELRILRNLRSDILAQMPDNAPARLRWELEQALQREDYETAARLRDALGSDPVAAAAD